MSAPLPTRASLAVRGQTSQRTRCRDPSHWTIDRETEATALPPARPRTDRVLNREMSWTSLHHTSSPHFSRPPLSPDVACMERKSIESLKAEWFIDLPPRLGHYGKTNRLTNGALIDDENVTTWDASLGQDDDEMDSQQYVSNSLAPIFGCPCLLCLQCHDACCHRYCNIAGKRLWNCQWLSGHAIKFVRWHNPAVGSSARFAVLGTTFFSEGYHTTSFCSSFSKCLLVIGYSYDVLLPTCRRLDMKATAASCHSPRDVAVPWPSRIHETMSNWKRVVYG